MTALLLACALAWCGGEAADTVLAMRPGDRVVVRNIAGAVSVEAGADDHMEVSEGGRADRVAVRRSGGRVIVGGSDTRRGDRFVELSIRLPDWVDVEIEGRRLDVSVRGMAGSVDVRNISGDVEVVGARGPVRVNTVQGEIRVDDATGSLTLSTKTDDIRVRGATGPVEARTVSGDVRLDAIRSERVRGEVQAGDIRFSGEILAGGAYRFFLHSGDARLVLSPNPSARVRVSTFHGTFESDFPVKVSEFTSGRSFEFTLGGGDAEVIVEAFDGEIQLLQGG
ncbi:MAG: DUF4097 family beta strand repeat-containing protein [Gemmatimonadota bacterium]|nr:DUF4097 family beta strand repeat-containing protein [Gemmatimonadota bacterium]